MIIIAAAVPTPYSGFGSCHDCPTPICNCSDAWGWVHFISATLFFALMGYLSIFHFTRRDEKKPITIGKKYRDFIYRGCGVAMWVILVFAGIIYIFDDDRNGHFIFWIEVCRLVCFGISWLVKGIALVDLGIQKEDFSGRIFKV